MQGQIQSIVDLKGMLRYAPHQECILSAWTPAHQSRFGYKQYFLNSRTWEENLEVIQKVQTETNKVGLSGNLPGGFYRRISMLLSSMAVESVQSLSEIIPARLWLAPCPG